MATKTRSKIEFEKATGEDAYKLWHKRIEKTLEWRRKHPYADKAWTRARRLVRGEHWALQNSNSELMPSADQPRETITVNYVGAYVRDFEAFLYRSDPEFISKARNPARSNQAEVTGPALTYVWEELEMSRAARRAVRDLIHLGIGILRTGFTLEVDTSKDPAELGEVEYSDYVRAENPVLRRVRPDRFLIDPEAPEYDLESARWCGEILVRPLADVLQNVRYQDSGVPRAILAGKEKPETWDSFLRTQAGDAAFAEDASDGADQVDGRLVVLVEIFDKKFRKRWLFLRGVEKPLLEEEWPYPYLDGFPYRVESLLELNDSHYSPGLALLAEDQQLEFDRVRTQQYHHRRVASTPKYQSAAPLNEPAAAALRNGETLEVVVHNQSIDPVVLPDLPRSVDEVAASITLDMRELMGHTQLTSSAPLPSRTSAREVDERARYTGLKLDRMIAAVDSLILGAARQILQHMQANVQKDRLVRILGPQGEDWVPLTPEDIRQEVDLKLVSTTSPRHNEALERESFVHLFEIVLQNYPLLQQAGVPINVGEMFKAIARKFRVEAEFGRFLGGVADPLGPPMPLAEPGAEVGAPPASGIPPEQSLIQQQSVAPESAAFGDVLGGLNSFRGV